MNRKRRLCDPRFPPARAAALPRDGVAEAARGGREGGSEGEAEEPLLRPGAGSCARPRRAWRLRGIQPPRKGHPALQEGETHLPPAAPRQVACQEVKGWGYWLVLCPLLWFGSDLT